MTGSTPDQTSKNCGHCGKRLAGEFAPHLCGACGRPQVLDLAVEDYFTAFGLPRRFGQDVGAIERRFYALSRALHPDRFAGSGPAVMGLSIERMSFLNQAFTVLRNPDLRGEFLLEREGVAVPKDASGRSAAGAMPADLAEAWFDLQDVVHESPATAGAKVEEFEDALGEKQEAASDEIRALERRYDENADRKVLEEIAGQVQARNYLHSLGRDVIRLKYRLQGKQSPWDA